jgi:metallo-beta-lactamase class B
MRYDSETLKVEQLTPGTFRHISYHVTEDFGKVACNGMITVNNGEALVCDTPINDEVAGELINWIENTLECKTIGIVVTHFHQDCLGGLNEVHRRQIPSYANLETISLAKMEGSAVPRNGFQKSLEINVGDKGIVAEFPGEGHTSDNIVCYFPSGKVLFGGCLIKSEKAGKGYLGDANIREWSNTVEAVRLKYGHAKLIIPGHGNPGGKKLLNYTIKLFKAD